MRGLVRLFFLLIVLGVGAELVAPSFVESRIEDRVRERTRGTVGVEANVDSFPLITRLLASGRILEMSIELDRVSRNRLQFSSVTYELEGVQLDRDALLRRKPRISGIEAGRISAVLDASDLASGFGIPVDLAPGDVEVEVTERMLRLREGALAEVSERVPDDIMPCDPVARVDDGRVLLECEFTEVPPMLLRAAEEAAFS